MSNTLLSIGHGYSAQALARVLLAKGWTVIGTTRSQEKADMLAQSGVKAVVWPGEDLRPLLQQADAVLVSAGPGPQGDPVLDLAAADIAAVAGDLRWCGYLSTTGVYGDHNGGWVDENTPVTPSTRRGKARVTAEVAWQSIPDLPLHIFRLAGIYGPDRGPFAKVRAGTARRIIKKEQVFSRIHVEDIAQVLATSLDHPNPGAIYNLCDDDPAPPEDVIAYAATLLGVSVPPAEDFETAQMTDMARSLYAESKRVRNDRIKNELGIKLMYPDYRTGLRAMLNESSGQS